MKNKKLVLSEIKVESFVPALDAKQQQTINGELAATKMIGTCAYTQQQNANACVNYTVQNCQQSYTCVTQIPANCNTANMACGGNSRTNCNTQRDLVCGLESAIKLCFVPPSELIFNC